MHNSVRELRIRDLIDSLTAGVSVRSVDSQHNRPAVLKTSAISKGRFDPTEAKTILSADIYRARCNPKRGSILVSRMNTPALVGEVGYVDRDFDELFLPDRLWLARARPGVKVDMRWLTYYLSSDIGSMAIRDLASGTSGSMKNIPKAAFLDLSVSTPTLKEQQKIAIMLGDVDSLIASLERLIAKKQAIKQGMMQQLLTGQTRLPGFTEPWTKQGLGSVGTFLKGHGVKRDDVRASGIPCLRYGELYTAFNDYTSATKSFVLPNIAATALPLRTGDLLFAGSGETRDEIGKCVAYIGPTPAVAGGDIVVLRGDGFNPVYLGLLANTSVVVEQKSRAGQGDAVVHISSRALADIEVSLPPRPEQDAIANVIMDADREIYLICDRLAKAAAIKKGMMQQLLGGRSRLSTGANS